MLVRGPAGEIRSSVYPKISIQNRTVQMEGAPQDYGVHWPPATWPGAVEHTLSPCACR